MDIASEPGRGTRVRFYLPKATEGATAAERSVREDTNIGGRGETVLVVEDDDGVREFAINVLDSLGYKAIGAADGQAGLAALERNPAVSVLLSDVVLPGGMRGPELAGKARERRPTLKVLFMSGYTQLGNIRAGEALSEAQLIRKPFRRAELGERLRAVLGS